MVLSFLSRSNTTIEAFINFSLETAWRETREKEMGSGLLSADGEPWDIERRVPHEGVAWQ